MSKANDLKNKVKDIKMKEKSTGTTGVGGSEVSHTHGYVIDENGNGKTTSTSEGEDHIHQITEYEVQPAPPGNHVHPLEKKDDNGDAGKPINQRGKKK